VSLRLSTNCKTRGGHWSTRATGGGTGTGLDAPPATPSLARAL